MPVKRRKNQALIFLVSTFAILAVDQYSKSLVHRQLSVGESIPVVKNILHITFVTNTGAAFGLLKDSALIFITISLIAVIWMSILILRAVKKGKFLYNHTFDSGLILIISGALGNLIDRLRFGYVIDFIDLRIWPVFNIADASISSGTFLLLLSFIFHKSRSSSR